MSVPWKSRNRHTTSGLVLYAIAATRVVARPTSILLTIDLTNRFIRSQFSRPMLPEESTIKAISRTVPHSLSDGQRQKHYSGIIQQSENPSRRINRETEDLVRRLGQNINNSPEKSPIAKQTGDPKRQVFHLNLFMTTLQDDTHPDKHTLPTYDITSRLEPFKMLSTLDEHIR